MYFAVVVFRLMYKLFNNILIPINLSQTSEKTIEKGIELANTYNCNIHLLHLATSSRMRSSNTKKSWSFLSMLKNDNKKIEYKLNNLTRKYQEMLQKGLKIFVRVEKGNRNDVAIDYIMQNKIDLVLEGMQTGSIHRSKMTLDINRIAGKTNAAVITIPEDRRIVHLYSIVIPVTDFIPLRKLMYGIYLARHYKTTIHLLGVTHEQDAEYSKRVQKYLQRSYQLIRDNCSVPIEMTVREGSNVAEVVKEYTISNNADLVIVNPGGQSRMKSHVFGWFTGLIQKNINPPVLTISAA